MPLLTAIETNPPMGGNTGWGEPEDPVHHKFFKERMASDANAEAGVYSEPRALMLAQGPPSPMEQLARSAMPYDDGWDCDYVDKLLYGGPAYVYQASVGSCVGASGASAAASKIATEIMLEGDAENPFGMEVMQFESRAQSCAAPLVDYSYGCGKMKSYWNGSKFTSERNLGDGSYCAVQTWAFQTCGLVPCYAVKDSGLVFPQTKSIRSNAGNQNQFLNRHLDIGLMHLMENTIRVQSADDIKHAIVDLKQPCMIASGKGFGPKEEIPGLGWLYDFRGSWAHQMCIPAFVKIKGNWYVKVRNQWGPEAHKDGWHFWISVETFDQWIRSAECQSIGELSLVPSKSIPSFPFQ